jgi:hypothetical protein
VDGRDRPGHDGVRDGVTVNNPPTRRGVYQFKTTSKIAPIAVTKR